MQFENPANIAQAPVTVGQNVELRRDGTRLIISVDLAATGRPSGSGKTTVIATTAGNKPVPGTTGMFLGVNLYAYPDFTVDDARRDA